MRGVVMETVVLVSRRACVQFRTARVMTSRSFVVNRCAMSLLRQLWRGITSVYLSVMTSFTERVPDNSNMNSIHCNIKSHQLQLDYDRLQMLNFR